MKTPTPPKQPPKVERAETKADKSVANLEGLTERLGTALEGILRVPARSRSEYLEKVQNALSGLFARLGGATEKMVDSLSGTLEAAAAKSDGSALALTTTYAEMRSTLKFAESDTMERVRHAVESFGGKPVAMETVRDKVMEELEPENGPQVRYANGARMSLKAYATMAARTARTETANMTALAQARETGTDYVYVPATTQGCELCISRSGRVYCISGKDSRFPPLTDLFPGSYKTIHPNCRCPLVPWYPEQYTPEEMRQAVQESNRSAKVKQDSPALARYKKQQEYNRQIIAEQRDFEAARQKYGAAMPYQSIASYRRAVRDFRKKHGTTKGFWESKGLTSGAKSDIITAESNKRTGIYKLDAAPHLEKHEIEDCYNTVNPHYKENEPDYSQNCQRCVAAYEARRRGFNVTAGIRTFDKEERIASTFDIKGWPNVFQDGLKSMIRPAGRNSAAVKGSISKLMAGYGNGARSIVFVKWEGSTTSHVFIAEQEEGKTRFIDPQTGAKDCEDYFAEGKIYPSETLMLRIDDKQFTDLLEECIAPGEEEKGND